VNRGAPRALAISIGDRVAFDYGGGLVASGTVVEDRGKIGFEGRRLFRIRMETDGSEPAFIELPESDLSVQM